jgi:two-component system, NtrC family, sensor kinase
LIGSIFAWPDRKGASDCADEVILARKGAKSRRRITSLRSKTTKARTDVDRLRAANADLKKNLTEALEQQTATSEVLQVISSSPGELEPVFQAMLANAVRICEARFGSLYLHEHGALRFVAGHNVPRAFAEARRRGPFRPAPGSANGKLIRTTDQSMGLNGQFFSHEATATWRTMPARNSALSVG